jgi:hypothetical protein
LKISSAAVEAEKHNQKVTGNKEGRGPKNKVVNRKEEF